MTDTEMVEYVNTHSRTPRALFHRDHINQMMEFTGQPTIGSHEGEWFVWCYEDAKKTIDKARRQLDKPKLTLINGGKL